MKLHNFLLKVTLGAAGVLLAAAGANAAIKGSQHDLGSTGGSQLGTTATTTEVCVFCHTPHGANAGATAPLWNRLLPSSGSFTMYSQLGTPTLDGEELAVGSVSLACLSCHDGSQAMDVVINAPGSAARTPATYNNTTGVDIATVVTTPTPMTGFPAVGGDASSLKNDHPVSIAYAGGACIGATAACDPSVAASGDPDFKVAKTDVINTKRQFWVDTAGGTADTREKTDMILYTRTFTGGDGPSVECGSCHDPHNTGTGATEVNFLRISNASSAVCLACHSK